MCILTLFVEAGGLRDERQGYIKDTDGVAPTVFVNVLVVNCSDGEHEKYDECNKKLFACLENKNM